MECRVLRPIYPRRSKDIAPHIKAIQIPISGGILSNRHHRSRTTTYMTTRTKKIKVKAWAPRFNIKVKYPLNNIGCHEWIGGREPRGYGRFWLNGKTISAHVAAYILYCGQVPKGMTIDHLCKNKSCVRPDHLEAVSMRENVLRSDNLAALNARKTHCKNGHPFTKENTYIFKGNCGHFRQCKKCWRQIHKRQYITYQLPNKRKKV